MIKVFPVHALKACRIEVQLHSFLTLALGGGQLHAPAALFLVKNTGTNWTAV